MEDLRDLLYIQNDDAHRVLADCEDELAVYNAIRNGVKSGELSVEPPIIERIGADPAQLARSTQDAIDHAPKVSGESQQMGLSNELVR
ncbi:hypothetical protein, partial [Collinsella sp. CLA-JM-H32B]|uniref:hypothetical protein n=1 Tax=Collinsella sp. CLA-JM-H32B TaxID=3136221 RepID=UPI0032BF5EA9